MTHQVDTEVEGLAGELCVGALPLQQYNKVVPDTILALFRDDQWTVIDDGTDLFDEPMYVYQLRSTAEYVRARLELFGITRSVFDRALGECRDDVGGFTHRGRPALAAAMRESIDAVQSLDTLRPMLSARLTREHDRISAEDAAQPGVRPVLGALHRRDPRLVLYAYTVIAPAAVIALDLTDLVSVDVTEPWWIRPDGTKPSDASESGICTVARDRLGKQAGMPPLRVLTEGATDTNAIRTAIELLRPEIADLVTFLSPQAKPERSASALARMANQFSATAVQHPIVVLFDNDGAGHRERRNVQTAVLPANIAVTSLPDLDLARAYPTLTATGTAQIEDINGRACGIELYFGSDVLAAGAAYTPIVWSATEPGHGAMSKTDKAAVQRLYDEKVKRAQRTGVPIPGQDWDGMHAVIETILDTARAMW